VFDCREIEKILVHDFVEFFVLLSSSRSDDRDNTLDVWIAQTLLQGTLADHSRCAENHDSHLFPALNSKLEFPYCNGSTIFC
jgi:hypothetical protein